MKLEGKYKFEASQQKVWEAFTNPAILQQAIPGCESLEEYEPQKFDAHMKIGIPAVKGSYTGKFAIVDAQPPLKCRLVGEGSGSPGFIKCDTAMELIIEKDCTVVNYQGDVQVGGLIAGIGQRMIGGIAKMMLNQFFKKMSHGLES
jgi:carbon monoxide dehydrogenase subunit G